MERLVGVWLRARMAHAEARSPRRQNGPNPDNGIAASPLNKRARGAVPRALAESAWRLLLRRLLLEHHGAFLEAVEDLHLVAGALADLHRRLRSRLAFAAGQ